MPRSGISRSSMENLWSHSTEKFCWRTLLCFTKFLVSKKLMDKRGEEGGSFSIFVHNFFSLTVPKTFVGEPYSVSLISVMEKFYAYEGNFLIFYRNFLCLTVPKNVIGEPFHVSQKFWYRKVLWIRAEGGSITIFRQKFCLTVPRSSVGEPFSVSLISGIENFYAYEGIFTIFYKNLLSHSTKKLHRGTLPCFTKILVSKSFMDTSGGREYHDFPSKVLSHSDKNFRRGTRQCFLNFRYRKFLCL